MKLQDAIKWVEKLTEEKRIQLSPVEGEWKTFYAGSLSFGSSCIAVPVKEVHDEPSDQFPLEVHYGQIDTLPGNYIFFQWKNKDRNLAGLFIEDLLSTHDFLDAPVSVYRRKCDIWKNFTPTDSAHFNSMIGLWGEMYMVFSFPQLAAFWTGPSYTDMDFNLKDSAVEIKTSCKKIAEEVNISSLWQLSDPNKKIYLSLIRVEKSSSAGLSLNDLKSAVSSSQIQNHVLEAVTAQLNRFGDNLNNMKLSCRSIYLYPVGDDFPLLDKKALDSCLGKFKAARIKKIKYTVSLVNLSKFDPESVIPGLI